MSLNTEEIEGVLHNLELDAETKQKIIAEVQALEEEKKALREGGKKKSKYKLTVLLRGDKELAEKLDTAWVVKTEEEFDDNLVVSKLQEACGSFNASSKRKKNYIEKWADCFTSLKRKFTKEVGVNIQTKEPVRVIVLENENVGETTIV